MYRRPSDEIRELRKRGRPWLAAALLLLLLLISAAVLYLVLDTRIGNQKKFLANWNKNVIEKSHEVEEVYDVSDSDDLEQINLESIIKRVEDSSFEVSTTTISYVTTTDIPSVSLPSSTIDTSTTISTSTTITTSIPFTTPASSTTTSTPTFSTTSTISSPLPPTTIDNTTTVDIIPNENNTFPSPPSSEPETSTGILSGFNFSNLIVPSTSSDSAANEQSSKSAMNFTSTNESVSSYNETTKDITTENIISTGVTTTPSLENNSLRTILSVAGTRFSTPERAGTFENSTSSSDQTINSLQNATDSDENHKTLEVHQYENAAVSSSEELCSEIGRSILLQGGNAVDAAVSTDICMGALHPHRAGLGGSTLMVIHQPGSAPVVINGLSTSARSVTPNTYAFNPSLARKGYSSVACPGNLAALWTAYKKFGSQKVAWQDLLLPTIDLLERGFEASSSLVADSRQLWSELQSDKITKNAFTHLLKDGELFRNDQLAKTLRRLASSRDPFQLFYRGDLANQITQEMRSRGALLTKLDILNYEAKVEEALSVKLSDGITLSGPMPPSTFALAQVPVAAIYEKYRDKEELKHTIDYYKDIIDTHDILETFRSDIADPVFSIESRLKALSLSSADYRVVHKLPKDSNSEGKKKTQKTKVKHVVSHVNVMDSKGQAVSLSSSLNTNFGSMKLSENFGFFWNNQMAEFSLEDSDGEDWNWIQGSKRPRSLLLPMILSNASDIQALLGVSASSCVEYIAAQITLNFLLLDKQYAVAYPRFCSVDSTMYMEKSETYHKHFKVSVEEELQVKPEKAVGESFASLLYKDKNSIFSVCDPHDEIGRCSVGY